MGLLNQYEDSFFVHISSIGRRRPITKMPLSNRHSYRGPLIHINRSLHRTQKAALLIRLLLICCKKVFGEIKVSGAFQRVIEGNFP